MNLLSSVQSRLRTFLDPEGDQLLRQLEVAKPSIDAGRAQVEQWHRDGVQLADLLADHPDVRAALADGLSACSRSYWIDLVEAKEIEPIVGRQSGLILLTLLLIWGVAAAERALSRDGIAAADLDRLTGAAVLIQAADRLGEEIDESDLYVELQAAAEPLWALYPVALSAPSVDDDALAPTLMAQTLDPLGPDPSAAEALARELERAWRLMNLSMIGALYRVIAEQVRKPA